MFNKKLFLKIYLIGQLLVIAYPPLQFCNGSGACISTGNSMIFSIPFPSTIDYSKIILYSFGVLVLSILIGVIFKEKNEKLKYEMGNDEELIFETLKPTLLKISEDVAMFRTQGMTENEALEIMQEVKKEMPKISHPYIVSTVKNVYKLPMSDVEELSKKSRINT